MGLAKWLESRWWVDTTKYLFQFFMFWVQILQMSTLSFISHGAISQFIARLTFIDFDLCRYAMDWRDIEGLISLSN